LLIFFVREESLRNFFSRGVPSSNDRGRTSPFLRNVRRLVEQKGRCHIDFCVTMCKEKALNPLQTWLTGFSAMYHYTTSGTASKGKPQEAFLGRWISGIVYSCYGSSSALGYYCFNKCMNERF